MTYFRERSEKLVREGGGVGVGGEEPMRNWIKIEVKMGVFEKHRGVPSNNENKTCLLSSAYVSECLI